MMCYVMAVYDLHIMSRPDGSCIPPGGPVPMKLHEGSTTVSVMSTMLLQVRPSSLLSIVRTSLLFRQKARMIFPVDASSTAAGFPAYKFIRSVIQNLTHNHYKLFSHSVPQIYVVQKNLRAVRGQSRPNIMNFDAVCIDNITLYAHSRTTVPTIVNRCSPIVL